MGAVHPIRVELDEGAKGVGGNWIDPIAVEKFNLKKRCYTGKTRFVSRIFPGAKFCPQEEVDIRLVFEPAGVWIALRCFVLPKSDLGNERTELIIGDADIRYFGIRELIEADGPLFQPAEPAREVLESLGSQLEEQALLEESFGQFEEAGGADVWDPQLDVVNFPFGSEVRARVVQVLEQYRGTVLVRNWTGQKHVCHH